MSAAGYRADQRFFLVFSAAVAVVVFVGFAQLSLRGETDVLTAPRRVPLHGLLMTCWLVAVVVQNWLADKGNIALHRRLGQATAVLTGAIAASGLYTIYMTVADRRPMAAGFGESFFLASSELTLLAFVGTAAWGMAMRRDTQWHRRLMVGAPVFLLDGAFGRMLPSDWSFVQLDVVITLIQLGALAVLAAHDRRVLGHVHRATLAVAVLVVLLKIGFYSLSAFPPFAEYATSIAG